MQSDRTLKMWYRKINKKYFDNSLPDNVCVRWANEDDDDEEERCEEKYFGWADHANDDKNLYVIVLSGVKINSLTSKLATLGHEMCHIATHLKDDHGPTFSYWHEFLTRKGFFRKSAVAKNLTLF